MGPPELAGQAAVPESEMAAAMDAPAGWSRDLALPLRAPGGGTLVGVNGQVCGRGQRSGASVNRTGPA